MTIMNLFLVIFVWSALGMVVVIPMICIDGGGAVGMAEGMEFVNPLFVYKYSHVNWFGALVLATFYGLISPMATVAYWFYKLCTVGRR